MWNMIIQFAKTKLLTVITKVNIKDILNVSSKSIDKVIENDKSKKDKKLSKEKKYQSYFPFTFFYGNGKFQPLYFFIFIFCNLAASMLFIKVYAAWIAIKKETYNNDMISTGDLGVVLGFISSLILLYNNNKKNIIPTTSIESKPQDSDKAN